MAVKTYCDICEIEIKQGDGVASITSMEKQFTLKETQGQAAPITKIVCGKCFEPIKKILKDGKK